MVVGGERVAIYTVAAAMPPPMWRVGMRGADSVMFRSDDRGESFYTVDRGASVQRSMVMRFRTAPDGSGDFFGVSDDGTVTRIGEGGEESASLIVAEKLPPAYDLVIVP